MDSTLETPAVVASLGADCQPICLATLSARSLVDPFELSQHLVTAAVEVGPSSSQAQRLVSLRCLLSPDRFAA